MPALLDRTVNEQGEVFVYAYTRWEFSLLALGDISGRTELYFTAKKTPYDDPDTEAILQLSEGTGLIAINKTVVDAADQVNGSITVTDVVNGDITIVVEDSMTGIDSQVKGDWDVKMIDATGAHLMGRIGALSIVMPVTRATS